MTATILHASDLHFGAEDRAALDWFARAVERARPELVLVTGDITQAGRRREFDAAAEWLDQLGSPVLAAPGNHDLPVFNLFERFLRPYRRYRRFAGGFSALPAREDFAVVPLKTTARAQLRLNWAEGRVDSRSLEAAVTELDALKPETLALVACHHPLIDVPGMSVPGRTRGGRAALFRLAQAGASAILTGHVHEPHDYPLDVGGRTIRMIGAGTLSERLRREQPSYNVVRVRNRSLEVEIVAFGTSGNNLPSSEVAGGSNRIRKERVT